MMFKKFFYEKWILGYAFHSRPSTGLDFSFDFKILNPPRGFCWADPFVVTEAGKNFVFFEEYHWRQGKGRICAGALTQNGWEAAPVVVMEADAHLSYPFIFKWRNEYYMVPESMRSGRVALYRAESFPYQWKLERVLLNDVQACDTTLFEAQGRWWMFTSLREETSLPNMKSVSLFYAETPLGPWTPHKRSPVKSGIDSSRSAGRPFLRDGVWYRPAQDCSQRYGYAISINRIDHLSPDDYRETAVFKILPTWQKGLLGTHTLNQTEGLTILDGLRWAVKYAE